MKSLTTRGAAPEDIRRYGLQKPFLPDRSGVRYLQDYAFLQDRLSKVSVSPPAKILEVGCGIAWMSEFLSVAGYQVTASTIDPEDAFAYNARKASLQVKQLNPVFVFREAPMEYVSNAVRNDGPFDAVFVYEALHHAHDWKKALREFAKVLRPGGWCFVCNEPNKIHTLSSYRIGRLSNTHEIGMSRAAIVGELRRVGFKKPRATRNWFHFWLRPIWVEAQLGPRPLAATAE